MLMKMRSKMQNQKGFTLVELMVVVVILGILVAIAVPVYNAVTENAEISAIEANLRTLDGAVAMYQANNDATSLVGLDEDSTLEGNILVPAYIKAWPSTPGTYTVTDGIAEVTLSEDEALTKVPAGTYNLEEFMLEAAS